MLITLIAPDGAAQEVREVSDDYRVEWSSKARAYDPDLDAHLAPENLPTRENVNAERDRRLAAGFEFDGDLFDSDASSVQNIIGSATLARFAVIAGAQAGDLRWLNPSVDFTWITQANVSVDVDAQTMVALGDALTLYRQSVIFAGRALKDTDPLPTNFTDDQYWP